MSPISAEFVQAQFSTYYRLRTEGPEGAGWTVSWRADIRGCGVFITFESLREIEEEANLLRARGANLRSEERARLAVLNRLLLPDRLLESSYLVAGAVARHVARRSLALRAPLERTRTGISASSRFSSAPLPRRSKGQGMAPGSIRRTLLALSPCRGGG